jgi:lysophospholipase L1-like esterase
MEVMMEFFENEKKDKVKRYQILNQYVKKGQILFVGSSLMEQFPIYEFIQDYDIKETIYNRGIGGYTTVEMLQVMDTMVYDLEPSKIFINIGSNDLNASDFSMEDFINRYEVILTQIINRLPGVKIYMMAYYPVNTGYDFGAPYMKQVFEVRNNARIDEVNKAVEELAHKLQLRFININRGISDDKGDLKPEYSIEGMHMYANGYRAVLDEIMKYVRER